MTHEVFKSGSVESLQKSRLGRSLRVAIEEHSRGHEKFAESVLPRTKALKNCQTIFGVTEKYGFSNDTELVRTLSSIGEFL